MHYVEWIIVTLLIGILGGQIAGKLKMPACMMIGSMLAVAMFNILFNKAVMPSNAKVLTQIITGIFIGVKIRKKDIRMLKSILIPAGVSVLLMIFFCIGLGLTLQRISNLDPITALLGCAPGGIVDITMLGMDLNADIPAISVLHTIRLVTVISVFPAIFHAIIRKYDKVHSEIGDGKNINIDETICENKYNFNKAIQEGNKSVLERLSAGINKEENLKIVMTAVVAIVFGLLGKLSGLPAGTLIFTMVSISVLNIITDKGYMPIPIKRAAQLIAGTLIGSNVSMSAVIELKALIIPVIIMLISYFIINIIIAVILCRLWHFDLQTAFFACTPGGASDISLMAEEFGGDTVKISLLQTLRSLSVISFYSFFIKFVL
jgi:membrane AbrB-like protein